MIGENEAPVITGATSTNFAENGTRAVASYRGRDPEGGSVSWTLLGTDSAYFAITNGGVLSFDPAPDFEDPMDSDRNNVYHVTVQASDGNNISRLEMTVTVTNVEEAGTVELSSVQPQVGTPLTATLDDPDEVISAITWSWQRSRAGSRSGWSTISNATSDSYTPAGGDVGRYLRATARYDDGYSNGKSASTISENTVRAVPVNNNPPRFLSQFTSRTVDENTGAGQNVGDPVTATDDLNDNLTYGLDGTDAAMFRIVAVDRSVADQDAARLRGQDRLLGQRDSGRPVQRHQLHQSQHHCHKHRRAAGGCWRHRQGHRGRLRRDNQCPG